MGHARVDGSARRDGVPPKQRFRVPDDPRYCQVASWSVQLDVFYLSRSCGQRIVVASMKSQSGTYCAMRDLKLQPSFTDPITHVTVVQSVRCRFDWLCFSPPVSLSKFAGVGLVLVATVTAACSGSQLGLTVNSFYLTSKELAHASELHEPGW